MYLENRCTWYKDVPAKKVYLLNQLSSNLDRWEALTHSNTTQVAFQVCPHPHVGILDLSYFPCKLDMEINLGKGNFPWGQKTPLLDPLIQSKVTNYLFKYEPLYVARAETPVFDERFIGFGMTRNTQVQQV